MTAADEEATPETEDPADVPAAEMTAPDRRGFDEPVTA